MKQPRIVGKNWELTFNHDAFFWQFGGDGEAVYRMVRDAFPLKILDIYEKTSAGSDARHMGSLYEDVVEFLGEWGIKAELVDSEPPAFENAPG